MILSGIFDPHQFHLTSSKLLWLGSMFFFSGQTHVDVFLDAAREAMPPLFQRMQGKKLSLWTNDLEFIWLKSTLFQLHCRFSRFFNPTLTSTEHLGQKSWFLQFLPGKITFFCWRSSPKKHKKLLQGTKMWTEPPVSCGTIEDYPEIIQYNSSCFSSV